MQDIKRTGSLDDGVLERYLAGACSPADRELVRRWVGDDPTGTREQWLEALRTPQVVQAPRAVAWNSGALWARVRADIDPRAGSAVPFPLEHLHKRSWWRKVIGLAAAALLIVGVRLMWPIAHPISSATIREFATTTGSLGTVVLQDGSRLTLGPASRVRVPMDFGRRSRSLELEGEALLVVVPDPQRPLVVHTAYGDVRDIGTTFDVRAYAADHEARVAVAEGSVAIAGQRLRANDVASVDAAGRWTLRQGVDVSALLAWSQGRLVFHGTSLRDVVRILSREFRLEITVADSTLLNLAITGDFTNQDVEGILTDITSVAGAAYQRTGKTVVIQRVKRPPAHVRPAVTTLTRGPTS